MDYEAKYGKQIIKCTATSGQLMKKRILFLLPAIIFIAAGILMLVYPEVLEGEDVPYLLPLLFGVGAVFLAMAIFFVKPATAILYEGGFITTRGSTVKETDFNDILGITDTKIVHTLYALIPVGNTRIVTIGRKDGSKFGLLKAFVPDFNRFCDELGTAISAFMLKGITKENIAEANISFGDKLELTGGHLVFNSKKEGMITIALETVRGLKYFGEGYHLDIVGDADEKGNPEVLATIRADSAYNLDSLYNIIGMYQ